MFHEDAERHEGEREYDERAERPVALDPG